MTRVFFFLGIIFAAPLQGKYPIEFESLQSAKEGPLNATLLKNLDQLQKVLEPPVMDYFLKKAIYTQSFRILEEMPQKLCVNGELPRFFRTVLPKDLGQQNKSESIPQIECKNREKAFLTLLEAKITLLTSQMLSLKFIPPNPTPGVPEELPPTKPSAPAPTKELPVSPDLPPPPAPSNDWLIPSELLPYRRTFLPQP